MAGHYGGNPYKWDLKGGANAPHIMRYFMAKGFVFPWETVLDAACATGYGSRLLAMQAKKVIGYEVDPGCIDAALQMPKPKNVEYHLKDLNECELPDVDVAVTIETVEHLTPEGMVHYAEQLRKHVKRCIIVSVPSGGSSFEYVNEIPGPATEKNDFFSIADLAKVIAPEDSGWRLFFDFPFGRSYYAIFARMDEVIPIPDEWVEKGFTNA